MKQRLYSALICLLLLACCEPAGAQELNCKVKILHEKITGTDAQVFTTMERSVTEFLNTRKWTNDDFAINERIDCNVLINITAKDASDPDLYSATFNISATRPVFNSSYSSPTVNYIDRDFVFHYSQFTPLQYDDNRVSGPDPLASNLTAFLAFYAYIVIGLDYDSFSPEGGSTMLKKAQNIVSNAPEYGKTIAGWKAFEDKHNRYWFIDQLLSPRFTTFRSYWYTMHREGLDVMFNKPAEGQAKVLAGINTINQLQKDNPGSVLIQFFFNAKSDELTRIVAQVPPADRTKYINILSQADVTNATRYNSLRQ